MMTLTAYARTIGKSKQYIHKLYQSGKLKESVVVNEKTGKIMIAKNIADMELSGKLTQKIRTVDANNHYNSDGKINLSLEEARLTKLYYEALMEKAKYEKHIGMLIEVDSVRKTALKAGLILKERVLSVASRMAPILLGQNSVFDIKNIITQYLSEAFQEFSESKFQEETK